MDELALNILDIANNSVRAKAKHIVIDINVDSQKDLLSICISDDGSGMSEDFLKNVTDPFTTTRSTRKVGMGIPLFKMQAELAGGEFYITSKLGEGTSTFASFLLSSVDRPPLGDVASSMIILISSHSDIEFELKYNVNGEEYVFDTAEVKEALGESSFAPAELNYLREMIKENIQIINGGIPL